ncbi:MAG: preprotein translocase subunit SecG [Candidatus Lariskella arthropodorum]|uniref:preprotein translocase subunit SecG n=1 Tax=Candidatus Lariskella endosymbiont of Epinotia ramella TaxID=3066224 RepID=UPI0030D22AF7
MIVDLLCIFQVIITLLLIFVVLLQKTGNDTISGLSSAGPSVFSSRSSSGLLKKVTIILAIAFMMNSLLLARGIMRDSNAASAIISDIEKEAEKDSTLHVEPTVPSIE